MGVCIECVHYNPLEGRCKEHNWPKENNDSCNKFDRACVIKESITKDIDEEDTAVIKKSVNPDDQIEWMIDWIENQEEEDD